MCSPNFFDLRFDLKQRIRVTHFADILLFFIRVVPHRLRGFALGSQYAILGLGGLLNNLMGGAIIKANSVNGWRDNLYISAAVQLLGTIMLIAFYRPLYLNIEEPPYLERIKTRIDWVGNALWICAFISLMFGLISGGNLYPWKSSAVIASLVIGFGLGLVLAAHQVWYKKDGIFQSVIPTVP